MISGIIVLLFGLYLVFWPNEFNNYALKVRDKAFRAKVDSNDTKYGPSAAKYIGILLCVIGVIRIFISAD